MEACGRRKAEPKNLEERLELLILKTKSGYDGLYEKMLIISKQLLSMNFIKKEHLDIFCP